MNKQKRSKTIFDSIFSSLLVVLTVEMLLLVSFMFGSGVSGQLKQNAVDILQKQVENRTSYLQTTLQEAQNLSELSSTINSTCQSLIDSGEISIDTLDDSSDDALPLLQAVAPDLIRTMREKHVSGIFIVLNTADLDVRLVHSTMPGLYLRDLDPSASPSEHNTDLTILRAPVALTQSLEISTDTLWTPTFRYMKHGKSGFLYSPFQAAYNNTDTSLTADDFGRWTSSTYTMGDDGHEAIAYSQPLMLSDGTVYGVVGVEMLTSYLQTLMPYSELQNYNCGTYFLATSQNKLTEDTMQLQQLACSTDDTVLESSDNVFNIYNTTNSYSTFTQSKVDYCASVSELQLYNRNSIYSSEHWYVVGAVKEDVLFAFPRRVTKLLLLTVCLTIGVGLLCSLLASHKLSKPVFKLSDEVSKAQVTENVIPTFSRTGIYELDNLADAFTSRSQEILNTSTRFLRILKMSSVEHSGYEVRQYSSHVYVTSNFFSMLGFDEPGGTNIEKDEFDARMKKLLASIGRNTLADGIFDFTIHHSDGRTNYVQLKVTCEGDSQVGLLEDITDVTLERMRIEYERDHDVLTGLYNRQAFERICTQLMLHPQQLKHAAMLMMDLDRIKQINDTYGHDWGDQYIRQTGQCISKYATDRIICSRMSGDEFLLLFYNYDTKDELRKDLDELHDAVCSCIMLLPDGRNLKTSASSGVAWYPDDGNDFVTLRKYADFAMYQVKQSGRGQTKDFDLGVYNQEAYEAKLHEEFAIMINQERISYAFQPLFSSRSGLPDAYEALMRVNMPCIGSPLEVMRLARETNRLYEIERITMFKSSEAFSHLRANNLVRRDALLFINSIANVSLTDLDEAEYSNRFFALRPNLVIEITEEEELSNDALERKRRSRCFNGVFALDDYGSGYSNESNLLRISPAYIKVDISIIRDIDTDPDKQQIVTNITNYAHQRGMKIVAEGIETAEELRKVLELDVDLLQGYFLAKPTAIPQPMSEDAQAVIDELLKNK